MRLKLALVLVFALALFLRAQGATAQSKQVIPENDRVRLAEAFRLGAALGDRVWKDWNEAPFAVLLVTPQGEFLIRHPKPPPDFTPAGRDALLESDVFFRARQLNPALLATFPVGGVPTIVVGQAENTSAKTSTPWVVTLLHEHFHQLQNSQADYYGAVSRLNLSRGDQTGMWMLNYAFPYTDPEVRKHFSELGRLAAAALSAKGEKDFSARLATYLAARRAFGSSLNPDDYRYFSFQMWQEGLARYTEYRVAELAAKSYRPSAGFRALKDYRPFGDVADATRQSLLNELADLRLEEHRRVAFYPLGAAEGLLLDRADGLWRGRYFREKFYVDRYFGATP